MDQCKRSVTIALFALVTGAAVFAATAQAQSVDAARGRDLYEQSCGTCHGKSVHDRNPRSARSIDGIRGFVQHWSTAIGARWSAEEIDAVTLYLNQRYYHYPCAHADCRLERRS